MYEGNVSYLSDIKTILVCIRVFIIFWKQKNNEDYQKEGKEYSMKDEKHGCLQESIKNEKWITTKMEYQKCFGWTPACKHVRMSESGYLQKCFDLTPEPGQFFY